jgi:uncharacterized protein (TIGR02145 family)
MMQYAVNPGGKGICPVGWYLPTDADWTKMSDYLGGESLAGGMLKETGLLHWVSPNTSATNASGFSALPGGYRSPLGSYGGQGDSASFMSSTELSQTVAWGRHLSYNNASADRNGVVKNSGLSVRCIRENNTELTKLTGDVSKTWKLLRNVTTGRFPLEVGPADHSTIWWAVGFNNDELANRPCMLNDEWTFGSDGTLAFDAKGDFWAEGGVFYPDNFCQATSSAMNSINGEDLSA